MAILTASICSAVPASDPQPEPSKDSKSNELESEMIRAAFSGDLDKVKRCLGDGARIDAIYDGDYKVFQGADGGIPIGPFTALMAAIEGDRYAIAEYLIARGCKVDLGDLFYESPLWLVAEKRKPSRENDKIAELLVKRGAKVNVRTEMAIDGPIHETILHRAVGWGHTEMVKKLVEAGADVNAKTSHGKTPIDYITKGRNDAAIRKTLAAAGGTPGRTRPRK